MVTLMAHVLGILLPVSVWAVVNFTVDLLWS